MNRYRVQYSVPGGDLSTMDAYAPNQWQAAVVVTDQVRRDDDVVVVIHRVMSAVKREKKGRTGKLVALDGRRKVGE